MIYKYINKDNDSHIVSENGKLSSNRVWSLEGISQLIQVGGSGYEVLILCIVAYRTASLWNYQHSTSG